MTLKGAAAAITLGCVLLVGIAEGVTRLIFPHWREFYSGWFMTVTYVPGHGALATGKPGFDGYFAQNNGDFRVRIKINQSGLRNEEPIEAAHGRLWVIGDSMAFGWGVERAETYTAVIAQKAGVQTYNVASPGTDICGYQALAGRMPSSVRPRAVIVGLVLENDIANYDCAAKAEKDARERGAGEAHPRNEELAVPLNLLDLKRFLTRTSALYNFFAVAVKRVGVFESLLTDVGMIKPAHRDHYAPAADRQDELVQKTVGELLHLRDMFPNTPLAVLIAPARFEIHDNDQAYVRIRHSIGDELRYRNIAVIDPVDRFKREGMAPTHFLHDGHWSVLGHRIAAESAVAWVKSLPSPSARSARSNTAARSNAGLEKK